MGLKEFLKPDWRKVVIFIVLFIIELIYYTWSAAIFCPLSACAAAQMKQVTERMQNVSVDVNSCNTCYSLPWESCSSYCGNPDAITSLMIKIYPIIILMLLFIIPYFVSCFIVWIYHREKKKK